jgi:hypothetical protein
MINLGEVTAIFQCDSIIQFDNALSTACITIPVKKLVVAESPYETRAHIAASQRGRRWPRTCVTFPVMLVFDSEKFFPTKPQAGEPPLVGPSAISCSKYPHAVGCYLINKIAKYDII